MRTKTCKICKKKFTPRYSTAQMVCGGRCAIEYDRIQKRKAWRKEKAVRKDALKTHSEWLKDLQKVFNAFIRERDKGKLCVSCGAKVNGTGHASHMFSVGAYPNLRFNEDNCHLSCVECNLHKHGNLVEYSLRLPERIGKERFEKLVSDSKKTVLKLSVPEIEDLIKKYKEKTKELK